MGDMKTRILRFDGANGLRLVHRVELTNAGLPTISPKIPFVHVVQASEQRAAKPLLKWRAESCTGGGTPQILGRCINGHMADWRREGEERKNVMISLHNPAVGRGRLKRWSAMCHKNSVRGSGQPFGGKCSGNSEQKEPKLAPGLARESRRK